jgi:hypothetical protein
MYGIWLSSSTRKLVIVGLLYIAPKTSYQQSCGEHKALINATSNSSVQIPLIVCVCACADWLRRSFHHLLQVHSCHHTENLLELYVRACGKRARDARRRISLDQLNHALSAIDNGVLRYKQASLIQRQGRRGIAKGLGPPYTFAWLMKESLFTAWM